MNKRDVLETLINYYCEGNKAKFASMVGITPQLLSNWIKRDTLDYEQVYSGCPNLSGDWLLSGEGNIERNNAKIQDKQNDNKVKTQYQNLIDTDDTLSDDDSIINNNKDKQQDNITYYPFKKGFYVPKNVYVIGTMNDIDRSVESLDFAFRRRFTFHEITAEDSARIIYSADSKDGWDFPKQQNAVCRMKALNNAIVDNDKGGLTEQHKIGGAYFLKLKDVGFNFNRLWNEYLRGILFEYLRGLPQKDIDKKLKELKNAYDTKNNDLKTQDTNTDSDSQNS